MYLALMEGFEGLYCAGARNGRCEDFSASDGKSTLLGGGTVPRATTLAVFLPHFLWMSPISHPLHLAIRLTQASSCAVCTCPHTRELPNDVVRTNILERGKINFL